MKTKNQEWKESGTDMTFKEWVRQDLNNHVQETIVYLGADGGQTTSPRDTYKPELSGKTILGINKWLVYGVAALAVVGIGMAISKKLKTN